MRIILIGTDRKIFEAQSSVRDRLARFGASHTDSQDSIVFSTRRHKVSESQQLAQNVHAYPTNSFSRLLYGWDALQVAKRLPRPDIVSAQDPFETGLAAFFIARHFRVPLAIEMHTDIASTEFARHSLLNLLRVMIAGFVLKRASGGYAVSERVRNDMVKKYKLKAPFAVFPIYVDLSRFEKLPRIPKKGSLLWIGRFTKEKNPMLAIKALAAARAGEPASNDLRLTMLGSGPLESSLRAFVKRLKLEPYVIFAGWKDPADYLPETELMLATSAYEGYGMAIVEALAAGVPVLSTDVGVAREAGVCIAEGDFSKALLDWLAGPRAAGALTIPTYKDEEDYFLAVEKYDRSVLQEWHNTHS